MVVFAPGSLVGQQTRSLDAGGHVGEGETDRFELDDRLAELLTDLGVFQRSFISALGNADGLGSDADPPGVEDRHRDLEPLALFAKPSPGRETIVGICHLARVGAANTEFVLDLDDLASGRMGVDQKGADAAMALGRVGHGHQDDRIGVVAIGDPVLDPVDHIFVALAHGGGLLRGGIRTGTWLGERERAQGLARGERDQQLALLLLGAELLQPVADQRVVDRGDHAQRGVHPAQLLDHDRIRDIIKTRATVLFRDRNPHEPKLAHFFHQLGRPFHGLVAGSRGGFGLFLGELAHCRAQHFMVFCRGEMHGRPPHDTC